MTQTLYVGAQEHTVTRLCNAEATNTISQLCAAFCCMLQGPGDVLGLGGEGGGSTDAAAASYLDAFATFRDEVRA